MELFKNDFLKLFDIQEITPLMSEQIDMSDFRYRIISESETFEVILQILKKIDSNTLQPTGDLQKWENGWFENLQDYKRTKDLNSLIPKYVHPDRICRLNQNYIKTANANFELNIFYTLRYWIMETYLKNYEHIFEFGCGSGYNVLEFAKRYPHKMIHGLDWAKSSVEIINQMPTENTFGYLFDVTQPDYNIVVPDSSSFVTFGCLEQIYTNYYNFIDFIMDKKPKIICNIEPIEEFYDADNLIDYMAFKFHRHRRYLSGYYKYLKNLENDGQIKILKSTRVKFGSFFHDGWSIIIWEVM